MPNSTCTTSPRNYKIIHVFFVAIQFIFFSCGENKNSTPKNESERQVAPVSFTAIGDVPYNKEQRDSLIKMISKHNATKASQFVVHLGDIKPGSGACDEAVYQDVQGILREFTVPTFIVLGDNEYNDCEDPEQGLEYWNEYFLHFNENWTFEPLVTYQAERPENFSWIKNNVLFIGTNLVGSQVHDSLEWQNRLTQNGQWVKKLLEEQKNKVSAMVLFGHANMVEAGPEKFKPFTDLFVSAARSFEKPVLMVQGDGHFWIKDKPWPAQNITRLQIDGRDTAVKITVNSKLEYPFLFDREFLN